jgi:methyltransferase (TIGR00027 family)
MPFRLFDVASMETGRASVTAGRVAERRAVHQILDSPLVFADRLALSVIDPDAARQLQDDPGRHDASAVSRALRAFVCVRSRVSEDRLADAVADGVEQCVVLGAGFDTFAYRNPFPSLRVFEVDHPATQAVKRARLAAVGVALPPTLRYVPADLVQDSLGEVLIEAGFDTSRPAFVSWLGVVPYLRPADITATLRWLGALPPRTAVVFDYGIPPESLPVALSGRYQQLRQRVAALGEPFLTFLDPAEAAALLRGAGFTTITDLGSEDINARYFADRTDGLRVSLAGRIVHAIV